MPVTGIRKAPSRKIQKPVSEEEPYRKKQCRFSRNNANAAEAAFPCGMKKRSDVLSMRCVGKGTALNIEDIRDGDARDSFLPGLPPFVSPSPVREPSFSRRYQRRLLSMPVVKSPPVTAAILSVMRRIVCGEHPRARFRSAR